MIQIYNRKTKTIEVEEVLGGTFLSLLYEKPYGKPFLFFVKRKFFSALYGKIMDTRWSRRLIPSFIEKNDLNISEHQDSLFSFQTFNDFFSRKLKQSARPFDPSGSALISPADARLLVFDQINKDAVIQVKGLTYPLKELIKDSALADLFDGGTVLVFRLNPLDYHRYHFIDRGIPEKTTFVDGSYYSVNPVALKTIPRLYIENKRAITMFNSENFGSVLYVEVGATNVGSIIETYTSGTLVEKGSEKGYFKFGGSTVILFFTKNTVEISEDILHYSAQGIESRVLFGETLGISKN